MVQDVKLDHNSDVIYHRQSHQIIQNFKDVEEFEDKGRARLIRTQFHVIRSLCEDFARFLSFHV